MCPKGVSPADLKKRAYFMSRLQILEQKGFLLNAEMAPTVQRNLTRLLARSAPTEQELSTLHGILTVFERTHWLVKTKLDI